MHVHLDVDRWPTGAARTIAEMAGNPSSLERAIEFIAGTWKATPPFPPQDPSDETVARYALRLALTFGKWVHRRNETFTFLDADTVRRRMSIDFSLPEGRGLVDGDTVLIPLTLLDKETLRNFDIRDEEDRALSVLTTEENSDVVVRGLAVLLSSLVEPGEKVDLHTLRSIVAEQDVDVAVKNAEDALAAKGTLGVVIANEDSEDARSTLTGLIQQLAGAFVLLAPLRYQPQQRRLIKLNYDAAHGGQRSGDLGSQAYSAANRFLSTFGLLGRVEEFAELEVGLGASYHCEAVPPADTWVAEATLRVTRGDGTVEEPTTDRHQFRPHLHAAARSRGDTGRLSLIVHAHREGLLFPLWGASTLLAAALWLVQDRLDRVEPQTLAAMLLVPFALATYYVRSAENSYVTVMLRGVRLVAGIPIAGGLLVVGMLALGYVGKGEAVPDAAADVAWWSARAAAGTALLLSLAMFSPAIGRVLRPVIRWLQRRPVWARRTAVAAAIVVVAVVIVRFALGVELPILG